MSFNASNPENGPTMNGKALVIQLNPDFAESLSPLPESVIAELYPEVAKYGVAWKRITRLVDTGRRANRMRRIPGEDTCWEMFSARSISGDKFVDTLHSALKLSDDLEDFLEVKNNLELEFPTNNILSHGVCSMVLLLAAAYTVAEIPTAKELMPEGALIKIIYTGEVFYE